MRTEDDYFDLVSQLGERLSASDPDERTREIAGQEADKRILVVLGIGVGYWTFESYGWIGVVTIIGLWIAALLFSAWRDSFDPKRERDLVTLKAEKLVRLEIIAEVAAAGQNAWALKEKEYDWDKRQVVASDNGHWDRLWERTYRAVLEFEMLSPRERERRILNAANAAKESLAQASDMAKRENAELIYWAKGSLDLLKKV